MTKVAIITRTKDRPLFLRRALDSVAAQTFTDYIHLIVNDGGEYEPIEELIASMDESQRSKTRVYHRDESSNAPDTIFNESIDRVDSEMVAIHDDDDTWNDSFLAETVTHLDRYQDVAAVVVRADKVIEELVNGRIVCKKVTPWMPDLKSISLYRQCIDNQFTPIATLFRRNAYTQVGKFDDLLPVVGDWEFGIRLLLSFDADFIDPGYALANYHHRKKVGSSQDAISSHEKHRYYTNKVANRYLRNELSRGKIGVGYIMSSVKYNQGYTATVLKKLLPTGVIARLKGRVRD